MAAIFDLQNIYTIACVNLAVLATDSYSPDQTLLV